jgi:hypothetical protein
MIRKPGRPRKKLSAKVVEGSSKIAVRVRLTVDPEKHPKAFQFLSNAPEDLNQIFLNALDLFLGKGELVPSSGYHQQEQLIVSDIKAAAPSPPSALPKSNPDATSPTALSNFLLRAKLQAK